MAADFSKTAELLESCGIYSTAGEIHGVLTGQVCACAGDPDLELTRKILVLDEEVPVVINDLFGMFVEDIRGQLQAEDYSFQPLLPADEAPLEQRIAALGEWCDGFNAGFAAAWTGGDATMAPETREVLGDFARIAQVDQEEVDDASDRENEVNFMEIVEYARMAAITVYLQNSRPLPPTGDEAEINIH